MMTDLSNEDKLILLQHAISKYEDENTLLEKLKSSIISERYRSWHSYPDWNTKGKKNRSRYTTKQCKSHWRTTGYSSAYQRDRG